jgi:serine protease Do
VGGRPTCLPSPFFKENPCIPKPSRWPVAAQPQAQPQLRAMPDFADLAEMVGPSVVNIRTTEKAKRMGRGGAQVDPNLEEFFRRFGIPMPGGRNPRGGNNDDDDDDAPQRRGVGSGFILSADGYVMTNAHVVDGADELIVTLTDKREFKAKVIGADTRTDVAVVKIEAAGLPAVKIGDVNKLRVGEWVMAIGSPFNLENTVTSGIVSAKQRDTGDYVPLLQTDVAVNPGNSGGPLLNLRGEVVGINSQIYSPSGAYAGISFAIPIDEAMRVADQLRAGGRVVRGRIGVRIAPVTKEVAESIGLGKPVGALVQGVEQGTPAEKAGIEAGDIIVKVDGRQVEKSVDLQRMIGATKPGSKSTLQVFRRGNYKDITLTVAELESDSAAAKPRAPTPSESQSSSAAKAHLGLTVIELTEAQKKELKVRGGVRVETAEGAAARAGIRDGDVILSIDNTEVADVKQFGGLVAKLNKDKPVTLLVRRGEWVNYIVIRPAR